MQKGFFMFYLNSSQKNDHDSNYQDSNLVEISILRKLLKKNQDENQLHKANIRRLLEQHKKLSSLANRLIEILETECPAAQKQASLSRQIKLFKRSIDF